MTQYSITTSFWKHFQRQTHWHCGPWLFVTPLLPSFDWLQETCSPSSQANGVPSIWGHKYTLLGLGSESLPVLAFFSCPFGVAVPWCLQLLDASCIFLSWPDCLLPPSRTKVSMRFCYCISLGWLFDSFFISNNLLTNHSLYLEWVLSFQTHTHTYAHTHARILTHTQTHIDTCTYTHMNRHTYRYIQTHRHTDSDTDKQTYTHMYTHTNTYRHIDTHAQTHT